MKLLHHYNFLLIITICLTFETFAQAPSLPTTKEIQVTVTLSDKLNARYEKYLLYAYNQLGYKVTFDRILVARAREMVNAGRLDGIMVAEKEIEQHYNNIVRVPVLLAKGTLILHCNKHVSCQMSALNDENNVIGVTSGFSISSIFMKQRRASIYPIKNTKNLGVMLTKGRLDYVLITDIEQLGSLGNLNKSKLHSVEVFSTQGYHYIHKKHVKLLPQLTKALQAAIDKFGPLVNSSHVVKE